MFLIIDPQEIHLLEKEEMQTISIPPGFHPVHHDRFLPEKRGDTYKTKGKLPEPTVCLHCHAVFSNGHWRWSDIPGNANYAICPACHRENDRCPAGFVTLEGPFFMAHRSEIMGLLRHEELCARQQDPLKRIMNVEHQDHGVAVTTTDTHLARAIGDAIRHAYHGDLQLHYNPDENLLRVHWTR